MPRRFATLTSPAPCGAFLCLSASPCNVPAFALPLPRAAALPAALPLSSVRPAAARLDKPRRPAAAAASLCMISQSPAAGRLCRPLTVPPLASPAPAVRRPWRGTITPLPARCRPRAAPEGRQPPPRRR